MPQWIAAVLGIWAVAIAVTDFATARIPNLLLLAVLLPAAVVLAAGTGGLLGVGPGSSLAGFVAGALIPLGGYASRMLGAGDVKFSAVLGLLVGFSGVLWILLLAAVSIGLCSVVLVIRSRFDRSVLKRRIPAGPSLALGFMFVLWGGPGRWFGAGG